MPRTLESCQGVQETRELPMPGRQSGPSGVRDSKTVTAWEDVSRKAG
jgi:hypothetical protein